MKIPFVSDNIHVRLADVLNHLLRDHQAGAGAGFSPRDRYGLPASEIK